MTQPAGETHGSENWSAAGNNRMFVNMATGEICTITSANEVQYQLGEQKKEVVAVPEQIAAGNRQHQMVCFCS